MLLTTLSYHTRVDNVSYVFRFKDYVIIILPVIFIELSLIGVVGVKKKRVALIFGGRSGEHVVSLMSAASVMEAIDKDKYEILPVGINREGKWFSGGNIWNNLWESKSTDGSSCLALQANPEKPGFWFQAKEGDFQWKHLKVDIAFPLLHGPFGEDGTIQGLLEMMSIPYVGSGVLASSVSMDKAIMKTLFQANGLPVLPYIVFNRMQWAREKNKYIDIIGNSLHYPCFVKPANLGSSVGITKVNESSSLGFAVNEALLYDDKIIVEAFADGREIECSVLGDIEVEASLPGEIIPSNEFYSYRAKYIDNTTQLIVPVNLGKSLSELIKDYSCKAFRIVGGSGLARVDFFVDSMKNKVWVSEINTMPGFTRISMYPKLWEASGVSYRELISRLLEMAEARFLRRKALRFTPPEQNDETS